MGWGAGKMSFQVEHELHRRRRSRNVGLGVTLFAFVACFVAGPLIYSALVRVAAVPGAIGALCVAGIASVVSAFALRQPMPGLSLTCLWLAWVLVISLFVLTLRRRLTSVKVWRASFVTGLFATTLPWFGLATAQLVTS